MKTLAIVAFLFLTLIPAQAQKGADLNGKWSGTMTRTAPNGTTQSIPLLIVLTQKAKVLSGTVGPNADIQWEIQQGSVEGTKVSFKVQQPDGPMRTFTLTLVKDRLQGEMLAEMNGQSFTAKVDAGRDKPAK